MKNKNTVLSHSFHIFFILFFGNCTYNNNKSNEISEIVCSYGPILYANIKITSKGEYFYASIPLGGEGGYIGNKFDLKGKALDYCYSDNQKNLFKYFEKKLDSLSFQTIKSGNYGQNDLGIGQGEYNFCVYYKNGESKCLYGIDFPNNLTIILEELLKSHKFINLAKVNKSIFFETSSKVYLSFPRSR